MEKSGVPASLIAKIISEWVSEYGPTFPLYGNETVRHDISGSIRPLLSSTEIPHAKILAEMVGVSKKTVTRIIDNQVEFVNPKLAEDLLWAMGKTDCWFVELEEYYHLLP